MNRLLDSTPPISIDEVKDHIRRGEDLRFEYPRKFQKRLLRQLKREARVNRSMLKQAGRDAGFRRHTLFMLTYGMYSKLCGFYLARHHQALNDCITVYGILFPFLPDTDHVIDIPVDPDQGARDRNIAVLIFKGAKEP